jgi:hypothetical protein
MATKEESLEGMEITPAAPHRSFPYQSSISHASVSCFCVLVALSFATHRGTLFIDGLGQDASNKMKIDNIGATR